MTTIRKIHVSTTMGLAAALLLLGVAGQAHADERFRVGIGGSANFVPMDSMDALTASSAYAAVRLDASAALPELSLIPGYELETGLRWDSGTLDGTSFGRIRSSLDLDTLAVVGRLRRNVYGPLSAFGQAHLGVQWASLALEDAQSSAARGLRGKSKSAVSAIGGGAELDFTNGKAHAFHVGLRVEGHYQLASSMGFRAKPMTGGSDELLLDTQSAELGSINTSGMSLGMSLVGVF